MKFTLIFYLDMSTVHNSKQTLAVVSTLKNQYKMSGELRFETGQLAEKRER